MVKIETTLEFKLPEVEDTVTCSSVGELLLRGINGFVFCTGGPKSG